MSNIKTISLYILIALFSFSCSENGTSPTQPDESSGHNGVKPESSSPTVRYDDLPDAADFVVDSREWDKNNLTYYFSNGTADIPGDQEQQEVKDAFDLWAGVRPLTFNEVNSESQADIIILWATGAHGDQHPFDGTDGILAHAFFPPPNGGSLAGDAHFDDAETWTLSERSSSGQPIDLRTVVAHELGHSLGLGHSQVQGALMQPMYSGSHRFLAQDDIDGIQNIYGPPPSYNLSVNISGTHSIDPGITDTWNAIVSHNEGSVSYHWYIQYPGDNNWYSFGNNSSVTTYFKNLMPITKNAALEVNVSSAGESASDTFNIQIYPACNSAVTAGNNLVYPKRPAPCN